MKNATKGALAAAAAGSLLLGGAGSLAYWTTTKDVTGGSITAGNLALGSPQCGDWTFGNGDTFGTGSTVVPGDVISKTCTYVITAVGDHLHATVETSTPELTDTFSDDLTVDATDIKVNGIAANTFTEADNAKDLSVTVKVTFNSADEVSQTLTSTLSTITVTANQDADPA